MTAAAYKYRRSNLRKALRFHSQQMALIQAELLRLDESKQIKPTRSLPAPLQLVYGGAR